MTNSQAREASFAGSSKQRRDSSPAQLAFSHELPVSSQVPLARAFAWMCPCMHINFGYCRIA